jgi:ankyrin repeat protein
MAAREGSYEAVKLLVSRGAEVQRTTDFGFSPLYLSSWNKHIRITYFLLKNGANVAEDIVQWQKDKILGNKVEDISQMLLDFSAVEARQNLLTKLGAALINGNIAKADSIWLAGKVDINGQLFLEGMPLIAMAILGEKESALSWVLEKGANSNAVALTKDYTPLMFAVTKNNAGMVKMLLNKGANKSLKDAYGKTALDYARIFGHTEIVALLE